MTTADKVLFSQAFNRLAVATRLAATEVDASMQQVYFEALSEFPIEAIERAARVLARKLSWFPKVAEWHAAAREQEIQIRQQTPLPAADGMPICARCEDSGWEERFCIPGSEESCGRPHGQQNAARHRYVTVCDCRIANPKYARQHRVPPGRER
jgi:hypothetical protein